MSDADDQPASDTPPADDAATEGGAASSGDKPTKKRSNKQGCLTTMTPATTPGCAGCLSAVFLVTTVVTVWTAFLLDDSNVPWRHSMSPLRIGLVCLLALVIPIVVYKTVQLWMETETAKFPDVDYAWEAGLQALSANGISLTSAPVFLIVGSASERQEKALLDDPALKLRVEGVPVGPAPLHWYASKDAVYLFCSDTSWTSALASLREELVTDARAKGGIVAESPLIVPTVMPEGTRTVPPAAPASPPPSPVGSSSAVGGTMMLDAAMLGELVNRTGGNAGFGTSNLGTSNLGTSNLGTSNLGTSNLGTSNLGTAGGAGAASGMPPGGDFGAPWSAAAPPTPVEETTYVATFERSDLDTPAGMEPVMVAPEYSAACLKQLEYVGGLLRRARSPVCPINGVLALVQFESIHGTPAELDELRQALRSDLGTLQFATQILAPTTALVVGLEKERGFRELVRRVGKDRAATQRFGRKFDVRAFPTKDQLTSLAAHVCGAFEDWAYALFREENALTRPGNTRLYELLSKVRCGWKERLATVLADSFGCDSTKAGRQNSLFFSGCYLAATGDTPDRRAFARGVIDKLRDEQEFVEWSRDASAGNRRQSTWAALGMITLVFLTASLVIMFVLARFK